MALKQMESEVATKISAVNAWEGYGGSVTVALRVDDAWQEFSLSDTQAVQLADQLRIITKTTD